jgi:hypothetical protein
MFRWCPVQKVDDFVDKATPVAEDAYAKAKPLAEQVQEND